MDENAIVNETCKILEGEGFTIRERRRTNQHGIDIVADEALSNVTVLVEAKGGTSSRDGSARFGKTYTLSQVFDRAAKGVFTCLKLRAENPDRNRYRVILAVPDSEKFHHYLEPLVLESLKNAGIETLFLQDSSLNSVSVT